MASPEPLLPFGIGLRMTAMQRLLSVMSAPEVKVWVTQRSFMRQWHFGPSGRFQSTADFSSQPYGHDACTFARIDPFGMNLLAA